MSHESKPSRLAVISTVLGIIIWLLWCGFSLVMGILAESNALDETTGLAGFIFGPVVLGIITLIAGIAGVVTGIQALRKGDPRRGLAIGGLVMNFICLCPTLLTVGLMLAAGTTDLTSAILKPFGQ